MGEIRVVLTITTSHKHIALQTVLAAEIRTDAPGIVLNSKYAFVVATEERYANSSSSVSTSSKRLESECFV